MAKMLKFREEALRSILKGVKTLSKAVIVTLGPRGRNVVINKGYGSPLSTKDGVTVAKEISLKDKFENIGANLVKEAASKTNDLAGDGTTTAIVLAEAIVSEGVKNVIAGANPMLVKKGIEKAGKALVDALTALAKPVNSPDEIRQIATISANNDPETGEMIAKAMEKVGKDGTITTAEAKGIDSTLEVVEGMQFDKGYCSPYFITNAEKMSVEFEKPLILITDKKLSNANQLVPFLEKTMENTKRPLLIIAEDLDSEALATLVLNKLKASMPVCAVKAPAFGDRRKAILQDIAILTGATVVTEEVGLKIEEVGPEVCGSADTVTISKEKTVLVGGSGNAKEIEKRSSQIRSELEKVTSDYEKDQLRERLAKLTGGVAVIHIGAGTEAEMKEKKARIEDALHATRAAVLEGIVPGGGVALIHAVNKLNNLKVSSEEAIGIEIVRKAAYAPAIAIANNCGKKGDMVAEQIAQHDGAWGYNGLNDSFGDLIADGVIDPVLVTKSAVIYACSVAGILITISCMITDKPVPKSKQTSDPSMDAMGGMGGMPGMGGMGGMGGMPGMGGMGGMPGF